MGEAGTGGSIYIQQIVADIAPKPTLSYAGVEHPMTICAPHVPYLLSNDDNVAESEYFPEFDNLEMLHLNDTNDHRSQMVICCCYERRSHISSICIPYNSAVFLNLGILCWGWRGITGM